MTGAQSQSAAQLLHAGIAAARAGERERARELLTRVTALEADNVSAWLWLSGVVDGPLEQEACLTRVLEINPDHAAAQKGLRVVRDRAIEALFAAANAAANTGDEAGLREALAQIVERDEENLDAWLWLSRAVDTPEDQEICYENILTLDPDNAAVAEKLAAIQQLRETARTNVYAAVEEEPPEPERPAPTLAAAVLGDEFREKYTTPPEPEPEPAAPPVSSVLWAKYEDRLACPYCAAPTVHADRRCKACHNRLWIKTRRRAQPSSLFWILLTLQAFSTVMSALGPFLILYFIGTRVGLEDFTQLLGVYFGLRGDVPPEIAAQTLTMLPRFVFFLAWLPFLMSAAYTIALYLRWTPIYYALLISAGLGMISSLIGLGIYATQGLLAIAGGIIGLAISVGTVVMMLKLEDDFIKDRWRILLTVDNDIKEGIAFLVRGRQYADQKMWARAAVHFRRAAALLSYQVDGYAGAAMCAIRLKDYDLAEYMLTRAREIEPENQQVAGLMELVAEQKIVSTDAPADESVG